MEETLILKIKVTPDPKNAKSINDLIQRNKEIAKIIKNAPREGQKGYKELSNTIDKLSKEYQQNQVEIRKFNNEVLKGRKETKLKEGSLKSLSANLKKLEKDYRLLSRAERNAARGRELQRSILATRKELLRAEKAIGDFRRQVGNYTRTLVGLNSGFGTLAVSVGQLRTLIGGLPALFNSASASARAFLLTLGPIAAIIGVIGAALSRFQGVIDRFRSFVAGGLAAVDVLVERVGRAGLAFEKLFDLDFAGFAEDFKGAFEGIGDEIANDAEAATRLSNTLQALRDREIASRTRIAQLNVDISEARRLSQEAEQKDRAEAIRQLDQAIALTRERSEIEQSIAADRVAALREQVALSDETTSAEDRSKLADAEVNLINIEKRLNDELRGLIRRRETLSKAEDNANKNRLTGLKALQAEQARLTEQLKEQILAGDDYSETVQELQDVTKQLIAVDETFKSLTEETTEEIKAQKGSLEDLNTQITEQTALLEKLNPQSEQYKETQNAILQLEAQRDVVSGQLATSINELNKAQQESIASLEDIETELRLRNEAQRQLESLTGTTEEVAKKRAEIERNLQMQLRQIRINRINDEQEALQQELQQVDEQQNEQLTIYANNETKKNEILLEAQSQRDAIRQKELELEQEKLEISKDNFEDSEKQKTEATKAEEEKRKALRDLAVDTAFQAGQKILELLSVVQQQQTDQQLEQIDKREEAALAEADLLNKTEAEKQKIREKFEAEREALQRQAANERKALALAEATIDIAGAVIKSLNSPPPTNVALAASTAALGAIQLAIISATNFATGGLVQPVQLEDGKIIHTPNIAEMSNGDNIFATVRVGEAVINERQIAALGGSKAMAAAGVPGFSTGGKVDVKQVKHAKAYATGGYMPRFSHSVIQAKAMQSGGLVTPNQSLEIQEILQNQNQNLLLGIEQAVARGSAKGSKAGIENSDISNQIARENERKFARTERESF